MERDGEIIAQGYDQVADEYAALESTDAPWPRLRRVRAFAADLPKVWIRTSVAETRCRRPANWRCATRLPALTSPRSRSLGASANVPTATFIRGDVREVDLPIGAFDAIVALYLIDNIAREDYPALFRRLRELLRPNGRLLLSAEPGEDPWQPYTWLGVPMFINTVPTSQLVQLLEEAGLSVTSTEFELQLEGGRRIEYAWITGEKLRSPGSSARASHRGA